MLCMKKFTLLKDIEKNYFIYLELLFLLNTFKEIVQIFGQVNKFTNSRNIFFLSIV